MHIVKTAGTSLRLMLQEHFDPTAVLHAEPPAENSRKAVEAQVAAGVLSKRRLEDVRFLTGHIPLWFCEVANCRTVTLVRNPVDLYASYYSYLRNDLIHLEGFKDLPVVLSAASLSFASFMNDQLADGVCRTLCAKGHGEEKYSLEEAKDRLASIDFGISEDFERSAMLLLHSLSLPPTTPQRANVTTGRYHPSPAERDIVLAHSGRDFALYEWAVQEFEDRYSRFLSA